LFSSLLLFSPCVCFFRFIVLGFCVSSAVDLKQTNFFVVVLEDHTDSVDSLSFVV
jgi:type IV secretory pathway component VirB8